MSGRARSRRACSPGPPQSQTYLWLATNVLGFSSNLPVLVMDTFGRAEDTSTRSSFVQLSIYEPVDGRTSLAQRPALTTRGGFHLRGSTSAGMPQPGFALQFVDEFNREQHLAALGPACEFGLDLYAPNMFDPVLIHNPFVHQLSRDMGRYSPRTRFIEVYMVRHAGPDHRPRLLRALRAGREDQSRQASGRHRSARSRRPAAAGGHGRLPGQVRPLGARGGRLLAGGASMVYVEPKEPVINLPQRAPQRRYIKEYFDQFDRALDGSKWKDPVQGYRAYIDVDSWIDFHVLEVLSGNVDSLRLQHLLLQAARRQDYLWPALGF